MGYGGESQGVGKINLSRNHKDSRSFWFLLRGYALRNVAMLFAPELRVAGLIRVPVSVVSPVPEDRLSP